MADEPIPNPTDRVFRLFDCTDRLIQNIRHGCSLFENEIVEIARPAPKKQDAQSAPAGKQGRYLDIVRKVKECVRCPLSTTRRNAVPGTGTVDSDIMFVGEGPGEQEDIQGLPFVGRAGMLLTDLMRGSGIARDNVYITNIVKCRPPNNRVPTIEEQAACRPYLLEQISLIRPKLIVMLGVTAAQYILQKKIGISRIRGQFITSTRYLDEELFLFPTFHPSFLLRPARDPNGPSPMATARADFASVAAFIAERGLKH